MELPSQDVDIPIPINSSFGGGHGGHLIHPPQQHDPSSTIPSHNNHINLPHIPSNGPPPPQPQPPPPPPPPLEEPQPQHQQHVMPYKKVMVKYKECLKNHAASMGGTAMDGCGEFMPSGEEGTIEAFTCSACNCHRNFHRKEVEGGGGDDHDPQWYNQTAPHNLMSKPGRKFIMGHQIHPKNVNVLGGHEPPPPPPPHHHHHGLVYPTAAGTLISSRTPPPLHHQMIIPYSIGAHSHSGPSESDEHEDGGGGAAAIRAPHHQAVKKRFRTKFTQEQKEKMFNFAEKVGWKIQKQEESVVQQFCQEIGVKRRVLKVWMHNNKHNLAKKNPSNNNNTPSSLN